jgi:hypothetical protein
VHAHALWNRSLAFWQDVRIARDTTGSSKPAAPEHMRDSLAGLSVEYARRTVDAWGEARR